MKGEGGGLFVMAEKHRHTCTVQGHNSAMPPLMVVAGEVLGMVQ